MYSGFPTRGWLAVTLGLLSVTLVGSDSPPESASFVMSRVTLSATAQRASSAGFETSVTLAQEGPVGAASFCNGGFTQNVGFWSILGAAPVPLVLRAARNGSDVDLNWTGSAFSFEVYRSDSPVAVVAGPNLATTTPACADTDSPPDVEIVYYVVIPAG